MSDFNYSTYLKIPEITNLQELMSAKQGKPAHDEMLFIIIHQAYELWFKQILWEMDSILNIFKKDFVEDSELQIANHRFKRIIEIQRLLISQIDVLETMTPLGFLEFRNYLFSASGFQSAQFRLVENKMGLRPKDRAIMGGCPYHQYLDSKDVKNVMSAEAEPSLFDCIEKWLERTPYLQADQYVFWKEYKTAVDQMFETEKQSIIKHITNLENQTVSLKKLEQEQHNFKIITEESTYNQYKQDSYWKFSYKALMAALFIQVYRSSPKLYPAFDILTHLMDIDEKWTIWRYRHAQMVSRMIGQKVGTGGSSGAEYLKSAAEKHKVFSDLLKLSTFFISESHLPKIPKHLGL